MTNIIDSLNLDWRKSSESMANQQCVEVATVDQAAPGVSWV